MVQLLLRTGQRVEIRRRIALVCALVLLLPALATAKKPKPQLATTAPQLEMDGGRKLTYEGAFESQRQARIKRSFWSKLVDVVAGPGEIHNMVRPYSIAVDSRERVIVTDPGAEAVHIFDFVQQKYKFIERREGKDALRSPQCVAVDKQDNIYVTDSASGKIFVFEPGGKFRRAFGSLKGGEGFFKRPTGIAVDSDAQRIYVTDTLRDKIYVLDMEGSVVQTIGKHGAENGEFNYPTELRLAGDQLVVVDAMNFRIQVLDKSGQFRFAIGRLGDSEGDFFRPKGVAVDSEGHIYVAEGLHADVQVFEEHGQLLYYFGQHGSGPGQFQLPTGLFIDRKDRIFVADSFNHRVQVFHYFGLGRQAEGGRP